MPVRGRSFVGPEIELDEELRPIAVGVDVCVGFDRLREPNDEEDEESDDDLLNAEGGDDGADTAAAAEPAKLHWRPGGCPRQHAPRYASRRPYACMCSFR